MYVIKAGIATLYSPSLFQHGFVLQNPVLKMETNKASTLTFTAPTVNANRNLLTMLKPEVKVYCDGDRIFRGRVLTSERDFYRSREIYCEGELAYLRDVILRPYSRTESVSDYFVWLIGRYNAKVEASKEFRVGRCTVTGESEKRENDQYPDVLSELTDKLLNVYGGYLIPRVEIESGAEVTYLDYLAEPGEGSQTIQYARNLLDLKDGADATPICTRLIPLGATVDKNRVTISSVAGRDYLIDEDIDKDLESKYGIIEKVATFDDIKNASKLRTEGLKEFRKMAAPETSIDVNAIDLSVLGGSVASLSVGKKYRIISTAHGYTGDYIRLTRVELKLQQPEKSRYVFGKADAGISKTAVQTTRTASAIAQLALVANDSVEAVTAIVNGIADYVANITGNAGWTVREWKSGRMDLERRQVTATVGAWSDSAGLKTAQATVAVPDLLTAGTARISCAVTGGTAWIGAVTLSGGTLTATVWAAVETTVSLDITISGAKKVQ